MRVTSIVLLNLCWISLGCTAGRLSAEPTETPAIVVSLATESFVQRVSNVAVETKARGIPIVVVRAVGDTEWWVQSTARIDKPGRTLAKCHFGNAKTPVGTEFEVVVLLAKTRSQAEVIEKQQVYKVLPTELISSATVRVRREAVQQSPPVAEVVAAAATGPMAIVEPRDRSRVTRKQPIVGNATGDLDPILLVRSDEKNSLWWIQDPVSRNEAGEFSAIARFGNDRTPAGRKFHLLVLTPRTQDEADGFKPGESLKQLPDDSIISRAILVELADPGQGAE